jgi:hypothetical protein
MWKDTKIIYKTTEEDDGYKNLQNVEILFHNIHNRPTRPNTVRKIIMIIQFTSFPRTSSLLERVSFLAIWMHSEQCADTTYRSFTKLFPTISLGTEDIQGLSGK